jgi:hypothetical protein
MPVADLFLLLRCEVCQMMLDVVDVHACGCAAVW